MRKIILIILFILLPLSVFSATTFNDTTADHKWSTVANWSDGKPDASDAVTVAAGVTSLIVDEAATCLSFSSEGTAGITVSGSGSLTVAGSFTLDANTTWTHTGIIYITTNASNITTADKSLSTIASFHVMGGAHGTLLGNINLGTKDLYVYGASTEFATGNFQIDCSTFGANSQSGAITLTLGSSTINCVRVHLLNATVTMTANTATVNATCTTALAFNYFGGVTWGGTITFTIGDAASSSMTLWDANTFANWNIIFNPNTGYNQLAINGNQTVSGTLTITGNTSNSAATASGNIRGWIFSQTPGTQRTITAATVVLNGNLAGSKGSIDFRDIKGAGLGSWDFSTHAVGDTGGNSDIIFRTATTYYATCEAKTIPQDYMDVWSTADDGTPDGSDVFPLPQDTIVFNNNSWTSSGNNFYFHSNGRVGTVDASAMTEANGIALPRGAYGDIVYTGSGVSIPSGYQVQKIDGRLKNERAGTALTINITPTFDTHATTGLTIASYGGTVALASNISYTGLWIHTNGNFDLNGKTLTCKTYNTTAGAAPNTRTLLDSAGGGKIILNGLTGTLFDTTVSTNLTISNAPAIQIGDGTKTLTGDVTFMGAGKTFGNFTVKKHAGNYDCIITGSNTFGTLTLETPDVTYQYSDLQLTSTTDQNITSLVADGTGTYKINLKSTAAGSAGKLSDTTGTNTVTNMTIQDITVEGGATWIAKKSTNVSGNTGWLFKSSGMLRR